MKKAEDTFNKLYEYLKQEEFKGWDPYDGLNSPLIQKTFLKRNYVVKLIFIQLFKKNPLNLRKLFLINKEYNPKGLGLFITAFCNLYSQTKKEEYIKQIKLLADEVLKLKSHGYSGDCWGYNFDWQARDFFFPKYSPTVVATSFVADSLFNAYELTNEQRYLDSALSSADFVINDLKRSKVKEGFIFSYSPFDDRKVYNASLLGSRLLACAYHYTGKQKYYDDTIDSVNACIAAQNKDGSWYYGEPGFQKWVDSFHTGYNLECLTDVVRYTGKKDFEESISAGYNYYMKHFFTDDGIPKYYNDKIYPVDIHAPAQMIVTAYKMEKMNEHKGLIDKVLNWTIDNMFDKKKGYFYYQKNPYYKVKIPYMQLGTGMDVLFA